MDRMSNGLCNDMAHAVIDNRWREMLGEIMGEKEKV